MCPNGGIRADSGMKSYQLHPALRFFHHIDITAGCWRWAGPKNSSGYGRLVYHKKEILAHRLSYEIHYGPIPEGMFVCHKCDNPACVRPDHLFLGAPIDNIKDCVKKGRNCRGEKNRHAVLMAKDVLEIRENLQRGLRTSAIMSKFKISQSTVSSIKRRNTWKHV